MEATRPPTTLTPARRYYLGEISLEDARNQEMALAREEQNAYRSEGFRASLNVLMWLFFPLAILAHFVIPKRD